MVILWIRSVVFCFKYGLAWTYVDQYLLCHITSIGHHVSSKTSVAILATDDNTKQIFHDWHKTNLFHLILGFVFIISINDNILLYGSKRIQVNQIMYTPNITMLLFCTDDYKHKIYHITSHGYGPGQILIHTKEPGNISVGSQLINMFLFSILCLSTQKDALWKYYPFI